MRKRNYSQFSPKPLHYNAAKRVIEGMVSEIEPVATIPSSTWENRSWKQELGILLLFVVLTGVLASPLLSQLDQAIIGNDNDVFINPWADWWTARALSTDGESLWRTRMMFYPQGANLLYHSFSHLNTAVSLLLRPLFGPLAAYNLVMLCNMVLNGFSMYQFSSYLTRSTVAGILAGIVFAFNSHSVYQTAHPVLHSIWCLPWITLFILRAFRERSNRLALLAAFFVFLGAATSTILIILIAIWLVILVFYLIISQEFPRPSWSILLVFGAASAILVLPLVYPLLYEAITEQNSSFVTDPYQSVVTDILSPIMPHWSFWMKRGLYFGIVPIILSIIAVRQRQPLRLWLLLVGITYLFAIGPEPTIGGIKLNLLFPWSLLFAPLLRNTYRLMILFALGWGVVTAYGWVGLQTYFDLRGRTLLITAVLVAGAIFVESASAPFPYTPVQISPFFTEFLTDTPPDTVLAILPTGRQEDKRYMFYQTVHERPITGGVISRAEEDTFTFIENNPVLRAGAVDSPQAPLPADLPATLEDLAAEGVDYLVLEKRFFAENDLDLRVWMGSMQNAPVYEDDDVVAYSLQRPDPTP